jgi:hypothetical protein
MRNVVHRQRVGRGRLAHLPRVGEFPTALPRMSPNVRPNLTDASPCLDGKIGYTCRNYGLAGCAEPGLGIDMCAFLLPRLFWRGRRGEHAEAQGRDEMAPLLGGRCVVPIVGSQQTWRQPARGALHRNFLDPGNPNFSPLRCPKHASAPQPVRRGRSLSRRANPFPTVWLHEQPARWVLPFVWAAPAYLWRARDRTLLHQLWCQGRPCLDLLRELCGTPVNPHLSPPATSAPSTRACRIRSKEMP